MRHAVAFWAASLFLLSPPAHAWMEAEYFGDPAEEGGGGGISFTGSDASMGLHCGVCHTDAPGRITAVIDTEPDLAEGYRAAEFFAFDIRLEGEHLGLDLTCDPQRDESCNQNGFALEVTDGRGDHVGRLCTGRPVDGTCTISTSLDVDTALTELQTVARPHGNDLARTAWRIYWIPPEQDGLQVHVWGAVVDGNGGDGTFSYAPTDFANDDVAVKLRTATSSPRDGCAAAPGRSAGGAWMMLVVLLAAIALRRRSAWLLALVLLACAPDPPPPAARDESMFTTQVLPVLRQTCLGSGCHEGPRPGGDLDLSSLAGLQRRPDAVLPFGPYLDGLLLLKTSSPPQPGDLDIEHAGFVFNSRDDDRFKILQTWVQAGAPPLEPRGVLTAATHDQPLNPPDLTPPSPIEPAVLTRFREDVEPDLLNGCTGVVCHSGVGGTLWLRRSGDEETRSTQNYLQTAAFIVPGEGPQFSPLVRKLVPPSQGGLAHAESPFYGDLESALASPIGQWAADQAGEPPPDDRSVAERFFASDVQPVLVKNGCFFLNCHGPAHFSDNRLDPGVMGEFSREQTHANYINIRSFLALGPFPELGRLQRKTTDVAAGGIAHQALAAFHTADDPDLAVLAEWTRLETEAEEARGGLDPGSIGRASALVYVEATPGAYPVRQPEAPSLGAHLRLVPLDADETGTVTGIGAPAEDLVADFLAGRTADIRAPAVSYDGGRVVFPMRIDGEEGMLLYQVDLATREVTAITTQSGDFPAVDTDPTFAWDDSIVFSSNRAGNQTPAGPVAMHLFRLEPGAPDPTQITFGPFQVYGPWLHSDGKVHFSQWRGSGEQTPIFRVLVDGFEPRDHVGNRVSPERILLGVHTLPDGREAMTSRTPEATVPLGELTLFTRSLGAPTDNPFRPPSLQSTGIEDVHSFAPLPDGQLVVARSSRGVDTSTADPLDTEVGLYLDDLENVTGRRGPALVDDPGVWEMWPAVIAARPAPVVEPETRASNRDESMVVFHSFVATDSLFASNQRLPAALEERVARIRVLAAVLPERGDPTDPENQDPIQRRIAEDTLEPDGSIALVVPPNTPLRYQSTDAEGLALNSALWHQAVSPFTLINQNAPVRFVDGFCGGCHGPRADPQEEPVTIDVTSGASLSIASVHGPRGDATPNDGLGDQLGFVEDIWPLIQDRCAECHDEDEPAGGIALAPDPRAVWASLLARRDPDGWAYVDSSPGFARRSYLVEVLRARELESPRDLSQVPHPATELADDERRRIELWIDLGASRSRSYR